MARIYLYLSAFGTIAIGIGYGLFPDKTFLPFLSFTTDPPEPVDLFNILRANMGLYVFMGLFFLAGALQQRWRRRAILVEAIFMGGLATGRLISLFADGFSSPILIVYMILEFALALWGYLLLKSSSTG